MVVVVGTRQMFSVAPARNKRSIDHRVCSDSNSKGRHGRGRFRRRVKKGATSGIGFGFYDLVECHPDRDSHRVVLTESLSGRLCYVVESTPTGSDSRYGRTLTWVADGISIGLRKEFFDSDGKLLKVLEVREHSQIDSLWMITRITMTNAETGHSTTMELSELAMDSGLPEEDFTEETMANGIQYDSCIPFSPAYVAEASN